MANKLTVRQSLAINALLSGQSKTAAAAAAGVRREQISRWLHQPEFTEALAAGEAELMQNLNRRLLAVATKAVDNLAGVIEAPDSQSVGVRAADVVLSRLLSIRELSEIEQRLTALEETKNDQTND